MTVTTRINGLDNIQAKLEALANPKKAKAMARKAARQAMNIVKDAAKQNAKAIDDPQTREAIYKNITVREAKTKSVSLLVMRVGIQGGASRNQHSQQIVLKERRKKGQTAQEVTDGQVALAGGDTRYWRYIELGTSKIPATPFMRPALANNIGPVTNKFAELFSQQVDAALSSS